MKYLLIAYRTTKNLYTFSVKEHQVTLKNTLKKLMPLMSKTRWVLTTKQDLGTTAKIQNSETFTLD
jgi:hypothetical protein